MGRYRWVWRNTGKSERLFQVGILADGSLYNPNNYPEDVVRAAVLAADARRHERRSRTAKQAAETRQNRQRAKVYIVARRVVVGQGIGPQDHCYVCGRALEDPQSIARGIGSECWQGVLAAAEAVRGAA
jgi:uncharacterized protein DUF6011